MRYKRWPNSRWWSEDATCVGCIMKEFETVAPDVWKTIAIEKIVDMEGMVDVA